MRFTRKLTCLAALGLAALFCGGCGGISASRTVSPLDFIMPGILKNDVPTDCTNAIAKVDFKLPASSSTVEVASVR